MPSFSAPPRASREGLDDEAATDLLQVSPPADGLRASDHLGWICDGER
jgi:hypothetical protein